MKKIFLGFSIVLAACAQPRGSSENSHTVERNQGPTSCAEDLTGFTRLNGSSQSALILQLSTVIANRGVSIDCLDHQLVLNCDNQTCNIKGK